jgi:hypothetical protein
MAILKVLPSALQHDMTAIKEYLSRETQPDYLYVPRSMDKEEFVQGLISKSVASGVQLTRDMISATLIDQLYDGSVQHRRQATMIPTW